MSARPLAVAGFLVAAVILPGDGGRTLGQPGAKPADQLLGADNCIRCHREPTPADRKPGGAAEFIRLDESTVWATNDLHGKAFEALSSPLGQQMGKLLGYDVTKRAECLACHAVDKEPDKPVAGRPADQFYTDYGVSCEACHGFATQWYAEHALKTWREKDPAYKEGKGLVDLRDPARRGERCAACHVGSAADGRFVTHAMFAAGHPPLPGVEVMAYSRDQPMHYIPPRENKYLSSLNPDAAWKLFHYRPGESAAARQVAVGAVTSLRSSLKLVADAAKATDPEKDALDLAHFDCYACHHDLQSRGWRQKRGFAGVPGRPQLRPGYALLARTVVQHATDVRGSAAGVLGQFGPKWDKLTAAFDRRPFGVPADVTAAANDLVAWCDAALKELEQIPYDPAHAAKLLKALATAAAAPDAPLDADAAQQFVWAADVLRADLSDTDAAKQIGEQLAGLKEMLTQQVRDPHGTELLGPKLNARLERLNRYDPDPVRAAFGRIAALVK
ncbi:MAG TPA: multiheme c-type cytochrome [Gemmataceae bacterium]